MGRKPKLPKEEIKYPKVRERDGLYRYRYSIINPETGKRKQKETQGFKTALEAFQEGLRIEEELKNKTFVEAKNITFSEYADEYLKTYKALGNVKNSTVFLREVSLKQISKYFGGLKLRDITKLQYQAMLNDFKDKNKSLNTIRILHVAGKMLFESAVEQEIIKVSPAKTAKLPSFIQTVDQLESGITIPRYLEKNELQRFLDVVKNNGSKQDYTVFFLLAYTGLRLGELCALKWKDIDRKNLFISITKTMYIRYGVENYELNTPKTKSSIREVDISKKVLSVLDEHASWQKELIMSKRDKYYNKGNFIFVNDMFKPGYPMIHEVPQRRIKEFLKIAELPETLTPHSLRHTHASLLAEAGVDLEVIQKRLGHKNDQITREIYLHVTKKRKQEAPLQFEKLME
ncbi:tyrosine-type recombinase/integrase [Paenibacillus provencensis]|uniref:Tyrosine-type recombinase/integrase n=1 Tax=Paenibacillus provencensis TaxID=441151 RepID=A0ABW3PKN4_9BACL|nr:tyrosine-type recombinase/integrase [Paenibacillus sp. MER 78]MCM3128983.1 tyrosine-type recombinase/integrase [Paenibacillus sp. MER 78]